MRLQIQRVAMILVAAIITLVPGAATADVTIDGDTPWVVTQADFDKPAVQKAIRDAERDWYKVFGYPPVIFKNDTRRSWTGPVVVFGSVEHTRGLNMMNWPRRVPFSYITHKEILENRKRTDQPK